MSCRRALALICAVGPILGMVPPVAASATTHGRIAAASAISFGKSQLAGEVSTRPTQLQFGPDGRLYALDRDGTVFIYTIQRSAPNAYSVTSTETVDLVKHIPNHDDDGTPDAAIAVRQATGMLVRGTADRPRIFVSSSDPRFGGGNRGDLNLDTNSGIISRLDFDGTSWSKIDLVRGLPRSEEDHSSNGLALDPSSDTLYVAQGGNTNMGAPSHVFAYLPEYALSASVLAIDLDAIGDSTYDLPTLDDPSRPGTDDANDPFGGNNGANQAVIVPGGPVKVYAAGFRNPYEVLISSKGVMYADDNGHNAGQGDVPIGEGPEGTCTNDISEPGVTGPDSLHVVTNGYYGGHPNPTRGNAANTFNGQSPIVSADAEECDYFLPGSAGHPVLSTDPSSSNGIAEYTASNFGGAMTGDLLLAAWDNYVERVHLDSSGQNNLGKTTLFSAVGTHPLDITTVGDDGAFPGTIWVSDYQDGHIYVFEPADFTGCTGANSPSLDEDGDGFTNSDEIDNNTDPCSAADHPHDWDGDHISDLNDPDDDNDGLPDTSDPFPVDASNGMTSALPQSHQFDNNDAGGGLLDLGFTGLITNGHTDYRTLYDPTKLTAGGAPGVLTIDALTPGRTETNDQDYGFQFGVKPGTAPFRVHTRVLAPFAGTTPTGSQSLGVELGTGDQDNYVKLVLTANDGNPGAQLVREVNGVLTTFPVTALAMPGPDAVDLFLDVDIASHSVQPKMQVVNGSTTGPLTAIGSAITVPSSWLDGHAAIAVGLLGNAPNGTTLSGTWDLLEAIPLTASVPGLPDLTIKKSGDTTALGDNIYNTTGLNQTRSVANAQGTSRTFLVKLWNDSSAVDSFRVRGPGAMTGFTVKYLKGTSGTTDITAAVLAGTYHTANINPGAGVSIRVIVTVASTAAHKSVGSWLVTGTSVRTPTAQDAVMAKVKVS